MNSGASTMPRKMLAAVDSPTAPPTLSVRSSNHEKPRTIGGRMRQWNSSVVSTLITSTIGNACSAQHEFGAGHLEIVGQLTAAEIAEDERGAGSAGGGDRTDGIVDRAEGPGDAGQLEQDERGHEREQEAGGG